MLRAGCGLHMLAVAFLLLCLVALRGEGTVNSGDVGKTLQDKIRKAFVRLPTRAIDEIVHMTCNDTPAGSASRGPRSSSCSQRGNFEHLREDIVSFLNTQGSLAQAVNRVVTQFGIGQVTNAVRADSVVKMLDKTYMISDKGGKPLTIRWAFVIWGGSHPAGITIDDDALSCSQPQANLQKCLHGGALAEKDVRIMHGLSNIARSFVVFWSAGPHGLEAETDDHLDGVKAADHGLRYCTHGPGTLRLSRDPSNLPASFAEYLQYSSGCIVNQLYEPEVGLVPRAALLLPMIPNDDTSGGFGYSMLEGHLYFQSKWLYVAPAEKPGCETDATAAV